MTHTPTILTIAGYDPYGGAGVMLDTKVIHHLGGYALSVITAHTVQNSQGVKSTQAVDSKLFEEQLDTLLSDIKVDALKIGMLHNATNVKIVAEMIKKYHIKNVVLDPIIKSSSGANLLDSDGLEVMKKELFALCKLVTPNIPEINYILDSNYEGKEEEIQHIAKGFFAYLCDSILIKGGHSSEEDAIDYLVSNNLGATKFKSKRVQTTHTHGTGCFLSSAIATKLAQGKALSISIQEAKELLYQRLYLASNIRFEYRDEDRVRKEPLL